MHDLVRETLAPIAKRSREDAEDVYRSLCNVGWALESSPAKSYGDINLLGVDRSAIAYSWRAAGALVADLVGEGEDYLDYYCVGREGTITDEIRSLFKSKGVRPLECSEV